MGVSGLFIIAEHRLTRTNWTSGWADCTENTECVCVVDGVGRGGGDADFYMDVHGIGEGVESNVYVTLARRLTGTWSGLSFAGQTPIER